MSNVKTCIHAIQLHLYVNFMYIIQTNKLDSSLLLGILIKFQSALNRTNHYTHIIWLANILLAAVYLYVIYICIFVSRK